MNAYKKLWTIGIGLAIVSVPLFATAADSKLRLRQRYPNRHFAARPQYPPHRRAADDMRTDRSGSRYRSGYGWDNTCLSLSYLPDQFACSTLGGDGI
jgi:hypothetical protein